MSGNPEPLSHEDLWDASQCVEDLRESDMCDDTPEHQQRLKRLGKRLREAANAVYLQQESRCPNPNSPLVDRVAEAIWRADRNRPEATHFSDIDHWDRESYFIMARSVIRAIPDDIVPRRGDHRDASFDRLSRYQGTPGVVRP